MRLFLAMSCGALVVSEPAWEAPELFDERHLVMCPTEKLVDGLLKYLDDHEARQTIVDAAYIRATQELTLSNVMSKVVRPAGAK